MRLREQTKKCLEELEPKALAQVYDLISELKRAAGPGQQKKNSQDYLKVRKALNTCTGSLTDDILMGREDRI